MAVLAFLVPILSRSALAGEPAAVLPSDDAYHFAAWSGGALDPLYTEWWYFDLFDARTGLKAIFSYFVQDPSGLAGPPRVQMVAVAYTGQGMVRALDAYPVAAFDAMASRADVTLGANGIDAADADTYRIHGASLDGRLAWDLSYAREAAPWFAGDRVTVGSFPWEKMSWLVYMPRALVTGTVVVDGRSYEVAAPGYHDHNWGEWIPTDALWNWAQFSDEHVAIELGDFIGKPVGLVALDLDGERTIFGRERYLLVHTSWALDLVNWVWYPSESILLAGDDRTFLALTMSAAQTAPLRGDLPLPLPDLIIYEQPARFDGQIWRKDPAGSWSLARTLRGNGFKEYTGAHY